MIDEDRNDEGASDERESTESVIDSITLQDEVAGDDPAGFEISGVGSEEDEAVSDQDDRDGSSNRGVGDWDPSSAGGGGGELY